MQRFDLETPLSHRLIDTHTHSILERVCERIINTAHIHTYSAFATGCPSYQRGQVAERISQNWGWLSPPQLCVEVGVRRRPIA